MTESRTIFGKCACGGTSFSIKTPADYCGHCHCASCRKSHSAAFVTWTSVGIAQFQWIEGKENLVDYRSSEWVTRSFCGICGTQLTYRSSALSDRIYVPSASLEELDRFPSAHVNMQTQVHWIVVNDDLPKFPGFD